MQLINDPAKYYPSKKSNYNPFTHRKLTISNFVAQFA